MPTIFISHGSPLLAITDSAARRFLLELGPRLPLPKAVVVLSAHYDAQRTQVTAAVEPPTIHDFGGFPRELHEIAYRAPGEPFGALDALLSRETAGFSSLDADHPT
jgi:4,5-DOPA dioxygenase extradiol